MFKYYFMENVFPLTGGVALGFFGIPALFDIITISRGVDLTIGSIGLTMVILGIYSAHKLSKQ